MIRFTDTLVQSIVSSMTTETTSYVPGMCNINTAEVAYRRKAMWIGIAISAVLFAVLLAFHVVWWLVPILLFIPVYVGAIGYLQVRNRFCVSYGSRGQQNADENSDAAHDVLEKEALAADKAKTRRMNLQALALTIVIILLSAVIARIL
jgi:hypothetical protein